jgi:outer membrane protein assembly factor BamE
MSKMPRMLRINQTTKVITGLLLVGLLASCSFPKFKLPRVYKLAVQQGNVITQEMVDKLKPGMTRSQVAYIMGEPILRNTFNDARWDYVYAISIPGYFEQDLRMSLFFDEEALSYFTGDLSPTTSEDSEEAAEDEAVEVTVEEAS